MNILIVDDEPLARQRIRYLLAETAHTILGEAQNGHSALTAIAILAPDIVLLDIQLPDMLDIEVADAMQSLPLKATPLVIFYTGYNEHALEAFRVKALDYLLKPIRQQDLLNALNRAETLNALQLQNQSGFRTAQLQARTHKGIVMVPIANIKFCKAELKYISIFYGQEEVIIEQSLKELMKQLPHYFIRTHRSYVVNSYFVAAIEKSASGYLLRLISMTAKIPVSRRHWPEVKKYLHTLNQSSL